MPLEFTSPHHTLEWEDGSQLNIPVSPQPSCDLLT
jgi:hypothetical protein|eukprot:COSAG06_NODE_11109_length_1566_cov_1.086571_2_plen_35_part_00